MPSKGKSPSGAYKPIEDYGIIGDLHTVALVGKDGSIDWCCLPHFDSPSIFASILDAEKGGYFKIAPVNPSVEKQMYVAETNILLTRFLSADGVGEVIDFMPVDTGGSESSFFHQIVRQVKVIRGSVPFRVECFPRFDYARASHELRMEAGGATFLQGRWMVGLSSKVELKPEGQGVVGEFLLHGGETVTFLLRQLEQTSDTAVLEPTFDADGALMRTAQFWRRWLSGVRYKGRWRETVEALSIGPEAADLCAYRSYRGGAYNEPSGGDRWSTQLGLPLYLDQGCGVYGLWIRQARPDQRSGAVRRVYRGPGTRSGFGRLSADHVWY